MHIYRYGRLVQIFKIIFILQNLILRTRLCITGSITRFDLAFHLSQTTLAGLVEMICKTFVHAYGLLAIYSLLLITQEIRRCVD